MSDPLRPRGPSVKRHDDIMSNAWDNFDNNDLTQLDPEELPVDDADVPLALAPAPGGTSGVFFAPRKGSGTIATDHKGATGLKR